MFRSIGKGSERRRKGGEVRAWAVDAAYQRFHSLNGLSSCCDQYFCIYDYITAPTTSQSSLITRKGHYSCLLGPHLVTSRDTKLSDDLPALSERQRILLWPGIACTGVIRQMANKPPFPILWIRNDVWPLAASFANRAVGALLRPLPPGVHA